jgi:hypothetical protein
LSFWAALACLREPAAFARYLTALRDVEWIVYAKRPFAGPQQVLDYLCRYTHRVAIGNSRLLCCENGRVRFRWKDYRANNKCKVMTLDADEFIRRFLLHTLPKGFRRIRHFGFLANACRASKLARIRTALNISPTGACRRARRLSRALRDPHRASHRCVSSLRRSHGGDRPLAALAVATTAATAL